MKISCQQITNQPVSLGNRNLKISPIAGALRCGLLSMSLISGASHAANIEVTSNSDDNGAGCTLREAIVSVNSQSLASGCSMTGPPMGSNDTITFADFLAVANTIQLINGELALSTNTSVKIDAANIVDGITVDAGGKTRVLDVSGASLMIDNMTLTQGFSDRGSGIKANSSTLSLTNTTVTSNTSSSKGGGIYITGSSLTLSDSAVEGNYSPSFGGGVHAALESSVTLNDSRVTDNYAQFNGAGIYSRASSVILNNSSVSNNSCSLQYGYGGGIYGFRSTINLNQSSASGNSASKGGGLYIDFESIVQLMDSSISNNFGSVQGGGLHTNESSLGLNNSVVSGNSAESNGGLYTSESSVTIINSRVIGNSVTQSAGGIGVNDSILELDDSEISENSARFGAGLFANTGAQIDIQNTTISGNSSVVGAGIYAFFFSSLNLSNSTLSNNYAADNSGGIFARLGSTINLSNSIVADSTLGDCLSDGTVNLDAATIIEDRSCNAIRSGDPGLLPLASNGAATRTHALSPNSIALNSGPKENCPINDQRGLTRDVSDGFCDVGAFEFNKDEGAFYVIPIGNGKVVVIPL